MTRSLNPGVLVNCSPAVDINAAIAIGTLSRQLGNKGYRSSRAGVNVCFTYWPAAGSPWSSTWQPQQRWCRQRREKPDRPASDTGPDFDASTPGALARAQVILSRSVIT